MGETAAPEVKSQVGRQAHISYISFGVYVMHVHMGVKCVCAALADVCVPVSMHPCRQVE